MVREEKDITYNEALNFASSTKNCMWKICGRVILCKEALNTVTDTASNWDRDIAN
jgi:hypothetical protein